MKASEITTSTGRLCLCLAALLFILAGCTPTSAPQQPSGPVSGVVTSLTPAETKTYQGALANIQKGDAEKAVKSLDKLAQAHPQHVGLWINLAVARYENNQIKEAADALAHAKKIHGDIAEIHNLSGLIAVKQGEYPAAEKEYQAAIKLKKNYADAHYNLALMYDIFYQDIAKAVEHYEQYLTLVNGDDKETSTWVEELKLTLKRRGEG